MIVQPARRSELFNVDFWPNSLLLNTHVGTEDRLEGH